MKTKIMAHLSAIVILHFLTFCIYNVKSEEFISCETNTDCEEGTTFCYEFSKICAPCIPCHLYNRRKSQWTKCPEKPLQCGACLDGFWEEILTGGEKRAVCLKNRSSNEEIPNNSLRIHVIISIFCALTVVCIAGVSYAAVRYYRNKHRIRTNGSQELNEFLRTPDSPPPYRAQDPLQLSSDGDRPTIEISAPISECMSLNVEAESLQKAVPFRQPDYAESTPEQREEPFEPNEPPENLDLHDDDTMPSSWTPNEMNSIDNTSIPDHESDVLNGFDHENSGSSVNPTSGTSASVNNVNTNVNSFTLNIMNFGIFNDRNGNESRDGNGDAANVINGAIGGSGNGLNGGTAIRLTEPAPQYVLFRP